MSDSVEIKEKYERNGWPSVARPDLKPPKGWSLSLITAVNRVRNHRLSPDGEKVAFIWDREDLSDVYTMPASGGWPARVSTKRGPTAYWDDEIPQWSPDSRWLAFTMDDHVHIVPREGGLPEKITDFASEASSPMWLPDNNRLVISVEREETDQLLLTDRDGSWPRPLTTKTTGDHWDARPSPDGKTIAYVFRPFDDLNRMDIFLIDLDTGSIRTLIGEPKMRSWYPRWSPEGRLAFLSERTGHHEIWLAGPDLEGWQQLTHLGYDIADIAWSPDSSRIACTVNHGGSFDLALVNSNSGEVKTLRSGKGYHSRPNWSPDGQFLTFEYEDSLQPPDLYRLEVDSGTVTQLTFSNLPALAQQPLVIPEDVRYQSFDGLEIPSFLYKPAKANGAGVVYPHGGPSGQYVYEWDIFIQYLVAKGYTVLAPNYRGSTGYGLEFERKNYFDWGKGDTGDCLHGAKFLASQVQVDRDRIAISGGSYGGYMTACCLSRDPDYLFACGVSRYGDANLVSSWAQCNRHLRLYTEIFLGHPSKNRIVFREGSPIYEVDAVKKPVLILHGLDDDVVPPQASEEWVEALRKAGKQFEYKTYAGEPHGFLKRETQLDVFSRTERFLDWYLLP